jgi:hypothetical protein
LGERLLCKQEVAGSIPAGSMGRKFLEIRTLGMIAEADLRMSKELVEAGWKPELRPRDGLSGRERTAAHWTSGN